LNSLDIEEIAEKVYKGKDDPYSAGERILNQLKIANSLHNERG
jgi:hypothetical protein